MFTLVRNRFILLLLFAFLQPFAHAQYPHFFAYDDETGLPSNEVYCILQDHRGFIWFGCDAGLYKYDGVRYLKYSCKAQRSSAITGLCITTNGTIYCYNFQSQLFAVTQNGMEEIPHQLEKISNITIGDKNDVHVNHVGGIAILSSAKRKWNNCADINRRYIKSGLRQPSASTVWVPGKGAYFLTVKGIHRLAKEKSEVLPSPKIAKQSPGTLIMTNYRGKRWIFSSYLDLIFKADDAQVQQVQHTPLNDVLKGRKITGLSLLSDGCLWICTYNGIVRFNGQNNTVKLFFPDIAFSDCLIDREGNYWFTTLDNGLMRVPNLNYPVWNSSYTAFKNDKFTQIVSDGKQLYFSSVNGGIGSLHPKSLETRVWDLGMNADAQSFDFIKEDNAIYFNINKLLYKLQNNRLTLVPNELASLKFMQKTKSGYLYASSFGTYQTAGKHPNIKLSGEWSREIVLDPSGNKAFIATNNGIEYYELKGKNWKLKRTLIDEKQFLSVCYSKTEHGFFAITFDGEVYRLDEKLKSVVIARIPSEVLANKIQEKNGLLHISTNRGFWFYKLAAKTWEVYNRLDGLASDNINDFQLVENDIWLVTGKGLQKIARAANRKIVPPKLYIRHLKVNNRQMQPARFLTLKYKERLTLVPESSCYRSNGQFLYAYRIKGVGNEWQMLPSSVSELAISGISDGYFTVELKVIDHLGNQSNVVTVNGKLIPPFWKTWWFIALSALAVLVLLFFIGYSVLQSVKRRERIKTELVQSQLKAIRAQMNPHFMYNTLNSIQDLILQNDFKNTNYYLSKFSNLMRQILAFSEEEEILVNEEVEMLSNYLELEKLRFSEEFSFGIHISPDLDPYRNTIPSLIVQPYVENAIKHGLLHKLGPKELTVAFTKVEQTIVITVRDNGIGRKQSEELKQRMSHHHKSFAVNAVETRLDLLNQRTRLKLKVSASDLFPEEQDTGTEVQITIPMKMDS